MFGREEFISGRMAAFFGEPAALRAAADSRGAGRKRLRAKRNRGDKIKTCLLLACLHIAVAAGAQTYFLRNFTVDQGLPSNETYQLLEDDGGNLLIATDRGAARYNGYSFETLPATADMSASPVFYIYKAPSGHIFFSGLQGALYRYSDSGLLDHPFKASPAALYQHAGMLIANFMSERHDSLWINYNNDYNYNYKIGSCVAAPDGSIRKLVKSDGIYFELDKGFYYRQLSDANSRENLQPLFITWKDGSAGRDSVEINWAAGYVRRLFYESIGGYDVFSIGRRLLVYKDHKRVANYLLDGNVVYLAQTDGHKLFVGFERAGVALYTLDGARLSKQQTFLDNLTVNCIYKDRQGGLWFATLEEGIYYSNPGNPLLWRFPSQIEVVEKKQDEVFVGDRSGSIQVYRNGVPVSRIRLPLSPDHPPYNLSFLQHARMVVSTSKNFYSAKHGHWITRPCNDVFFVPGGGDTIYGANSVSPSLHTYRADMKDSTRELILSKRILSMMYTDRLLLVGTVGGLFTYANGVLRPPAFTNRIFTDRIVSIQRLGKELYAVASLRSGLAILDRKGSAYYLDMSNGLKTPVINSMDVEDTALWLGTNKGLARVTFAGGHFSVHNYGTEAGLPTLDIHQFKVAGNFLYLKWFDQLVTIPVDRMMQPRGPQPAAISSVWLTKKNREYKSGMDISYRDIDWQFGFISTNLGWADQQVYHYKLEGFDTNWNTTGERYAKYTNLPPGNYMFRVRAVSLSGGKPSAEASFRFVIPEPYWITWWFLTGLAILIVLIVAALFYWRLRVVKRQNRLLLDLAESKQKALLQLIKPHFVFNVLNVAQAAILRQDKLAAASIISGFARFMRMSLELTREKSVRLEDEIALLRGYFQLESLRFPDKFSYDIVTEGIADPGLIEIPSMIVQPFVENAINHGVRHLGERRGHVLVRFRIENEQMLCIIDDNGVGRARSRTLNGSAAHRSAGIDITLNRLRLLHSLHRSVCRYDVDDKKNDEGNSLGTTIFFSIPYKLKV